MQSFQFVVTAPEGIHARPAGLLVKAAKEFSCDIRLRKGEKSADCKRLLAVMALAIKTGETASLVFEGKDEAEACAALRKFAAENL